MHDVVGAMHGVPSPTFVRKNERNLFSNIGRSSTCSEGAITSALEGFADAGTCIQTLRDVVATGNGKGDSVTHHFACAILEYRGPDEIVGHRR